MDSRTPPHPAPTPLAPSGSAPAPYANPYLAGFGIGLALLIAFVTLGTGLGASGSIARVAATASHAVAPKATESNEYLSPWFEGGSPLGHYLVFLSVGTLLGGFLSAFVARRVRVEVERGPRISVRGRLILAVLGGVLSGFASRMAGGCTSGQALTGGALLLDGSWAYMFAVFAGGFGTAWFVRRAWL